MIGLRAFREAYLSADTQRPEEFSSIDARRARYALYWALYENTAYRAVHSWAGAYKAQHGLYRYVRNLYNPAFRLATFWQTHLWGGALDPNAGDGEIVPSALPIQVDSAPRGVGSAPRGAGGPAAGALRAAIARVWLWSNWPIRKDVITLWGSVMGDVGVRVVDDVERGKVYLAAVHPATLAEVTLDAYNNVKAYTIEESRPHPDYSPRSGAHLSRGAVSEGEWDRPSTGGSAYSPETVTYTETAERGDGDDVVFRTYLDGRPYAWNGTAAEWVEPYGFIPLVLIRHNDVGLDWGWSELHPARPKIQEVDDLASMLSDQIRKSINASWILAGLDRPRTTPAAGGALPTSTQPEPGLPAHGEKGREEITVFYSKDPSAKAIPLVAPLDIAGACQHIDGLLKELERDYPELRFDNLRVSGEVSGATLRVARQPVETKVNQRRAAYDDALVRAHNMAVAIGGLRRLGGFESFDLGSYARGDLQHSIALRPVFDVDPLDRLDEDHAFWENANLARAAGIPVRLFLQREGWDDDDLAAIPAEGRGYSRTQRKDRPSSSRGKE